MCVFMGWVGCKLASLIYQELLLGWRQWEGRGLIWGCIQVGCHRVIWITGLKGWHMLKMEGAGRDIVICTLASLSVSVILVTSPHEYSWGMVHADLMEIFAHFMHFEAHLAS